MTIDFSTQGRVAFDMIPYINKIIDAFQEKITGIALSPAADHLFHICPPSDAKLLLELQACACHHTTAQLLFLSCVCCDIKTTVVFLTTRVKAPDEDDWGKLKWVLKYLLSTCHLCLTLFADSLTDIKWYVDASHQTHDNCNGPQAAFLPLAKAQPPVHLPNKKSLPKAPLKQNSLVSMTNQVTFYGHDISSKLKVTKLLQTSFIRTI
jgi:hypothetical protein